MRLVCAAVLGAALIVPAVNAQAPAPAGQTLAPPAGQVPTTPPGQAPTPPPGQAPPAPPPAIGAPTTPQATASRAFTAPAGLLFNTVRPERAADFEKAIAYLQAALEKSIDPKVQEQARGWKMFKATEPGPNGTVLYVFELDPTVAGADYGLGRILADAYPDAAKLTEIWNLYRNSVTGGGTLLNLTPLKPTLGPDGELVPSSTTTTPSSPASTPSSTPATTEPPQPPPDANPNVPGR
jgi:hypothetical protein